MANFFFLWSLMTAARKSLFTIFCKQFAPMMQRAVGDPSIPCDLGLRFIARSHKLYRFLLKFSCKGSLLLLHDPFPFCGESTLSSLLPPLLWVKTTLLDHFHWQDNACWTVNCMSNSGLCHQNKFACLYTVRVR